MEKIKLPIKISLPNSFFNSNKIIDPKRDWNILMVLFICMILSFLAFDAYFYDQVMTGDMYISVTKEELTLENLKLNEIKKVIQDFELRRVKVANFKAEPLADPSM